MNKKLVNKMFMSTIKLKNRLFAYLLSVIWVFCFSCSQRIDFSNDKFKITISEKQKIIIRDKPSGKEFEFIPSFRILFRNDNPKMEFRPANISNVPYNVVTWVAAPQSVSKKTDEKTRDESHHGDGFDSRILDADLSNRTADIFQSGESVVRTPFKMEQKDSALVFYYANEDGMDFRAWISLPEKGYPKLTFEFTPSRSGYYSIGYTGAPSFALEEVKEIWQPLIWQEKRFPDKSYMTMAYRCPLPTTLVSFEKGTVGVIADPSEYPFDPLPLPENSRFGVAVRNEEGLAQPMLFAPVMGGRGSSMVGGQPFTFTMQLFADPAGMLTAYKTIAEEVYGFADYRSNGPHQLNRTLDNMIDYGMSHWSYFIDSLKGCAYSTDVPGAVKNVSSLNPLEIALVNDDREIYEKRAYPILEYMLSREKFLFSLDKAQKIQHPSRKLNGPVAPVSELSALYNITNRNSGAFLALAEKEIQRERIRNLDKRERGDTWQNELALYQATNKDQYLRDAIEGARQYITDRVNQAATDFDDPDEEAFFWTGFVPDFIGLFQLFEETGDREFLDAANRSALQYTQFIWFSPKIPDDEILVNKDGLAPHYWYLKSKGHVPMKASEEYVPAWRLSEIGLTPESSGTSTGHRAIFMANYAPWMYRIGFHSGDRFLINVARSAVIGRYSNFPGYHINTARTTVYEKPDYPLQPYKQLSVNSFHFNHIWPHATILLDYLVTDAYVKSERSIDFPSEFIEGYAYLQSKFYGHKPGTFYGSKAWLWMPKRLMELSSSEINYLTARGENAFFIAFTNQSKEPLKFTFNLNKDIIGFNATHNVMVNSKNGKSEKAQLIDGSMSLEIAAEGIAALTIENLMVEPAFQHLMDEKTEIKDPALHYRQLDFGDTRAMILQMGRNLKTAYIYLGADDEVFREVRLSYSINGVAAKELRDVHYPYEFTIELEDESVLGFSLTGIKNDGTRSVSESVLLGP
jgi:hypothetical protein